MKKDSILIFDIGKTNKKLYLFDKELTMLHQEYTSFDEKIDDKGWQKVDLRGTWFPDAFVDPMAGLMCKFENQQYDYINSVEDAIHTMKVVEDCYLSSNHKFH